MAQEKLLVLSSGSPGELAVSHMTSYLRVALIALLLAWSISRHAALAVRAPDSYDSVTLAHPCTHGVRDVCAEPRAAQAMPGACSEHLPVRRCTRAHRVKVRAVQARPSRGKTVPAVACSGFVAFLFTKKERLQGYTLCHNL